MRTLLLGTDFMYNSNGDLVPIEINTNVGKDLYTLELPNEIYQLSELDNFITTNNFTSVVYIGSLLQFNTRLSDLCVLKNITYTFYEVYNGLTIPYVEDNDDTLIIRSAYDSSAIVDERYCKDKIGFLNLIKNSSFGSQFAYRDPFTNEIINNINVIRDNGNHPNFILKNIYPDYNINIYPKFYKITTQDELNVVLNNLSDLNFLMEIYINTDKLFVDHIQVFRSLNILFPPDLNSIPIGKHTKLTGRSLDELSTFDPITFELSNSDRDKYISDTTSIGRAKLLDTDKVQMSDGTFKTGDELQVGDLVKTIIIPHLGDNILESSFEFNVPYNEFLSGATYAINEVTYKGRVDKLVEMTLITFTDDTTWSDTTNSIYLIYRDNNARFAYLNGDFPDQGIKVGDSLILIESSGTTVTSVLKEVKEITRTMDIFGGWTITVHDNHLFLTQTTESQSNYVTIETNTACDASGGCLCSLCPSYCPKGWYCCPSEVSCDPEFGVCQSSSTCVYGYCCF